MPFIYGKGQQLTEVQLEHLESSAVAAELQGSPFIAAREPRNSGYKDDKFSSLTEILMVDERINIANLSITRHSQNDKAGE